MSFAPLFIVIMCGITAVTLTVSLTGESSTGFVVITTVLLVSFALAVAKVSAGLLGDEDGEPH